MEDSLHMLTANSYLLSFVICLASGRVLWSIPDDHMARCVQAAFPGCSKLPASNSLGRSAKAFLGAMLLFVFAQSRCPGAGILFGAAWSLVENVACSACSFVFHTVWSACA
jgi:hypothetical protein